MIQRSGAGARSGSASAPITATPAVSVQRVAKQTHRPPHT